MAKIRSKSTRERMSKLSDQSVWRSQIRQIATYSPLLNLLGLPRDQCDFSWPTSLTQYGSIQLDKMAMLGCPKTTTGVLTPICTSEPGLFMLLSFFLISCAYDELDLNIFH